MKATKRRDAIRRLLELCDDLQRIRRKISDPELRRDVRARLLTQSRRKAELLRRDLSGYRFKGPVGKLMRELQLSPDEFQVLALLLHRHLRSEDPACEGRLILSSVFESSFEVLSGMALLHGSGKLRTSGLVVLEDDEECGDDVLEARFRLSDEAVQAFREEVTGGVPEDLRSNGSEAYANHREFLVDLRILHNLYQTRSDRVFNQDRWDRVHTTNLEPGRGLTERIDAFWAKIRRKLKSSPRAMDFPVVRFMTEHGLTEEETVLAIHLLFKELYEGVAHADAAELIKLVSRNESDLIRNRRLLQRGASLITREIVTLEPMIENRELTAEVNLADWAVNMMFGTGPPDGRIHPDERLEWHLYLEGLKDAGTFFKDMDAN